MYAGKFCYWCGKPTIQEPTGKYDTSTGEAIVTYRCEDDCKHGNHRHVSKTSFGGWVRKDWCSECGKTLDVEGDG